LYVVPVIVTASVRPALAGGPYGGGEGKGGDDPLVGVRRRIWRGKL
jgi:hypothetical protein